MKLLLTIIIICGLTLSVNSQYNPGAKQIALSNSDVALSNDVFCLFNNPAGLSQINWREIGIYYSPAPFGLTELANGYVAYLEPFSFGSVALGGMTYGFDLYRESRIQLGYSYNYDNSLFLGTSLNYHTVSIKNYGNDAALYFNFGLLAFIKDNIRVGCSTSNINRAVIGNDKDLIPVVINAGFSIDAYEDLILNVAMEKEIKFNPSFQFGINYNLIEYLELRFGFSNEPSKYSAGIGINYSYFSLDYAMFTHNDLGLTHQAGVTLSFDRVETRSKAIRNFLGIK